MYRTHSCGALTASDINKEVTLAGWVQKSRDKGFMIWIDLRDRYGLTQLIFDEERTAANLMDIAKSLGREFVIQVTGTVIERQSKNPNMKTGAIEVLVTELTILNAANEIAVAAFLKQRIKFTQITQVVENTLQLIQNAKAESIDIILHTDMIARRVAEKYIADIGG